MTTSSFLQSLTIKAIFYGSIGAGVYVFSDWCLSALLLVAIAAIYAATAIVVSK